MPLVPRPKHQHNPGHRTCNTPCPKCMKKGRDGECERWHPLLSDHTCKRCGNSWQRA